VQSNRAEISVKSQQTKRVVVCQVLLIVASVELLSVSHWRELKRAVFCMYFESRNSVFVSTSVKLLTISARHNLVLSGRPCRGIIFP